jgi:hypothetical protein
VISPSRSSSRRLTSGRSELAVLVEHEDVSELRVGDLDAALCVGRFPYRAADFGDRRRYRSPSLPPLENRACRDARRGRGRCWDKPASIRRCNGK